MRSCSDLLDLIGEDGLLEGDDLGEVEYAHRYAQGTAIYGGTTDIVRNMIGERFMGFPRSRPRPN